MIGTAAVQQDVHPKAPAHNRAACVGIGASGTEHVKLILR